MRPALWVEVLQFITDTDEATLVELTDGREVWIPFSAIDQTVRRQDDSGRLLIATWLVRKESLPHGISGR